MRNFRVLVLTAAIFGGVCSCAAAEDDDGAAAPAAKQSAGAGEYAQREWKFYSEQDEKPDADLSAALLADIDSWLRRNEDKPNSDAALFFKAQQQLNMEDYKGAVVTLLRHIYEYPDSSLNFKAKSLFNTTIDKRMDRKLRQPLMDMARLADAAKPKTERVAEFLKKISDIGGDSLFAPLLAEYGDFFARYPDYKGADELLVSKGALYGKKELYLGAVLAYERLLAVYPESPLRATAKRLVGDVYSVNLKNNPKAIEAYQYVVDHFASSPEAGTAYAHMAKLSEAERQYDLAVDVYEKIAKLYDGQDASAAALLSEARVLRENLKRPQDAVNVLLRVADKYKGDQKEIDALKQAAQICRKDLRDFEQEIKMYSRIVADAPDSVDAPAMLYESAKVYDKDLLNPDKAVETYQQVVDRYPGNSIAKSAAGRIQSLKSK
ncbi:MAG: tetratricopeptide repeat protein [Elusimicrobiales bacterium]|nr:tetratricopeptide repeat protein [Elusimicrobiales bacterium]